MSHYDKGRRFEWKTRDDLAARRRDILDRLRHQKPAHRRSQP